MNVYIFYVCMDYVFKFGKGVFENEDNRGCPFDNFGDLCYGRGEQTNDRTSEFILYSVVLS